MFNFIRESIMKNNASNFAKQYETAKRIMFRYLFVWFKQIFSSKSNNFDIIFNNKPDMAEALAHEVLNYLISTDIQNKNIDKKTINMAKKHAKKWADDCMKMDNEFSYFVIQTIRLREIYKQFIEKKVPPLKPILMEYGELVKETPTPISYSMLIKKWEFWESVVDRAGI